MEPRIAAGILLYRLQKTTEFLLIHDTYSHRRHWTPPRGYLSGKETEVNCALRNTTELTGLQRKDILIEEGFSFKITYLSDSKPKQVTYYLAQISDYGKVSPPEGISVGWFNQEQANDKAAFRSMQDVISKATEAVIEVVKGKLAALASNSSASSTFSGISQQPRSGGSMANERPTGGLYPQQRSSPLPLAPSPPVNAPTHMPQRRQYSESGERSSQQASNPPQPRRPENDPPSAASQNPLYKTKLCERYEAEGWCPYEGRCVFAHGLAELKNRPVATRSSGSAEQPGSVPAQPNPLLKTKLCSRYMNEGSCPFAERCTFAHGEAELRTPPPPVHHSNPPPLYPPNGSAPDRNRPMGMSGNGNPGSHPQNGDGNSYQPNGRSQPAQYSSSSHSNPPFSERRGSPQDSQVSMRGGRMPLTPNSFSTHNQPRNDDDRGGDLKRFQPPKTTRRPDERQFPKKNADSEKSWIKVMDNEEEKERFQLGSSKIDAAGKKLEKMKIEDQAERELREFFSVPHTLEEKIAEVTRKEGRYVLSGSQLLVILLCAIMEGDYPRKLREHVHFFQNFVNNPDAQVTFLKAWEKFVERTPGSESQVLHVLKCLYETDLVEEEAILKWHSYAGGSAFHQKGLPFINWLQAADEESD